MKRRKIKLRQFLPVLIVLLVLAAFAGRNTTEDAISQRTVERREDFLFTYEKVRYPTRANVTKMSEAIEVGISVDVNYLDFGIVPIGTRVRKTMVFNSSVDGNSKITLESRGNISQVLKLEKYEFILGPNEDSTAELTLEPSATTPIGYYEGEVDATIKRVKNDFAERFL